MSDTQGKNRDTGDKLRHGSAVPFQTLSVTLSWRSDKSWTWIFCSHVHFCITRIVRRITLERPLSRQINRFTYGNIQLQMDMMSVPCKCYEAEVIQDFSTTFLSIFSEYTSSRHKWFISRSVLSGMIALRRRVVVQDHCKFTTIRVERLTWIFILSIRIDTKICHDEG